MDCFDHLAVKYYMINSKLDQNPFEHINPLMILLPMNSLDKHKNHPKPGWLLKIIVIKLGTQ